MVDAEGSMNLYQGDERTSTASPTARARVFAYLDEHPELARKPGEVAARLHVTTGYAKRLLHDWRKAHRPSLDSLLGPVLLQNVRIVGGTDPDTVSPGSLPSSGRLAALGPWKDRGDHKLTAAVPLPHLEGAAEVVVGGSTLELRLLSPRGFTLSEVHLVLALLGLPFDRDAEATLTFEAFRDGASARFEGVEARTYLDAEGLLLKAYNHEDGRGTLARVEVRPPAVKLSWDELEAFFERRQPVGRDAKLEALALQVRENSEAMLMLRREVKRHMKEHGSPDGSPARTGGKAGAVPRKVPEVSP